jgi:Raf kinase inhibitor-like YbhB/YbcL family protein
MTIEALNVTVDGIRNNQPIPERCARCIPDNKGQSRDGDNRRPAINWSNGPSGTRSYTVIVVDKDVPTSFDAANKPDKTIPADMPRKNFYHWLQADIPADVTNFSEGAAGEVSPGISGRNSFGGRGTAQGIGYDGPCPPWNDERLHHYHFQVYALDVPSLKLSLGFEGGQLEQAMQGHILAMGEVVGIYTTNQRRRQAA